MEKKLRQRAMEIFKAGVDAADPQAAVKRALAEHPLAEISGRLILLSMGKAAHGMVRAAQELVEPAQIILVGPDLAEAPVQGPTIFAAGHPIPDANSVAGALAIEAAISGLNPDDHVLALISGGASALVCAPDQGIDLADKIAVNRVLLGSGLDITAMNLVRQNLSRLKGGGLARLASPASVTALILSDVIGNDLRVVASGPTAEPIGGRSRAVEVLKGAGVWDQLPEPVQGVLGQPDQSAPMPSDVDNRLIGSNEQSVAAMAAVAEGAEIHTEPLTGDVADAVGTITSHGSGTHLFGGETTVRLTGTGLGGRNQELALRVALAAEKLGWPNGWVFLSGGTDGRDGPTDAAGGLVDGQSLKRMRAQGVDPAAMLANNDSYHALKSSGDLLFTGATGTNVADLQVLIRP